MVEEPEVTVSSYADEQVAIYEWLSTHWAETDVAKPNAHFEPSACRDPYVEVRIRSHNAFNASVGASKRVRHPGLLTLVVRVPINRGDGLAKDYADQLANAFRNALVDGSIHFRAPTVRDFGPSDGWYEIHVDCPYHRDTVFSD